MSFSKILQRVVDLARQIETAHMAEDKAALGIAENELEEFLKPLKVAEIYMLITVMYFGRGDTGVAGLGDTYQQMSNTFPTPSRAIGQMIEKSANLHQYFQNALSELENAKIPVDTLLTTYFDTPLGVLNSSEGVQLRIGPWYCDKCGQVIEQADNGMLQWLARTEGLHTLGRDLRIVHHMPASPLKSDPNACYPNEKEEYARDRSTLSDYHLNQVLGSDGLVTLLALVEDGEFPASEVNRIVMRLFVPGYEQARRYFRKAIDKGVVDQGLPFDYFHQSDLRLIVANIPRFDRDDAS